MTNHHPQDPVAAAPTMTVLEGMEALEELHQSSSSSPSSADNNRRNNENTDVDNADEHSVSVATTMLATEVGSVVNAPKDAFLRSLTFSKNQPGVENWSIKFAHCSQSNSLSLVFNTASRVFFSVFKSKAIHPLSNIKY